MKEKILGLISRIKLFGARKNSFVYVALGDSTVEGVGASHSSKSSVSLVFESIRLHNKRASFHNLGKSGARIENVVREQLDRAVELEPNLITLSVGANDLLARTKPSDFEDKLSHLLFELKSRTSAKIIINNIPDISVVPAIPHLVKIYARVLVKRLNAVIYAQAKKHDVIFVDLYRNSNVFIKKYPKFISKDGFHPSDTGYALWAAAIISQLQTN